MKDTDKSSDLRSDIRVPLSLLSRRKGLPPLGGVELAPQVPGHSKNGLLLPASGSPPAVSDAGRATATFTISTPRRDRHKDVVMPKGCVPHLHTFACNPRVFFNHDTSSYPLGSAKREDGSPDLDVLDDRVVSTCHFHLKTRESEQVFALVDAGEISCASIGFIPHRAKLLIQREGDEPTVLDVIFGDADEDAEFTFDLGGMTFTEWELYEWSIVPVPANPDAIAMRLSKGVSGKPLAEPLRRAFEPYSPRRNTFPAGNTPVQIFPSKARVEALMQKHGLSYAAATSLSPPEFERMMAQPKEEKDVPDNTVANVAKTAVTADVVSKEVVETKPVVNVEEVVAKDLGELVPPPASSLEDDDEDKGRAPTARERDAVTHKVLEEMKALSTEMYAAFQRHRDASESLHNKTHSTLEALSSSLTSLSESCARAFPKQEAKDADNAEARQEITSEVTTSLSLTSPEVVSSSPPVNPPINLEQVKELLDLVRTLQEQREELARQWFSLTGKEV